MLLLTHTSAWKPLEGTTSSPLLTCSSTSSGVLSHGENSGLQKPPPGDSDATQNNPTYNPISATWDLIRDSKLANEALLTVGLPPEFDVLYKYARGLEFDDLPDYEGLRRLFRGLAQRVGIGYDDVYDWTVSSEPPKKLSHARRHPTRTVSEGSGRRRYCEACNAKGR